MIGRERPAALRSAATDRRLRVLFVARAFPPTVGGMEQLAHQLSTHLAAHADVTMLVNRRGKKALPLFLPYAAAAAVKIVRHRRVDVVHLADALLAPLGAVVRAATGVTVTSSVCGLDVTYPNRFYQAVVPRALGRLDMTMPISAATMEAMSSRCATPPPARVIPLGVNALPPPSEKAVVEFARLSGAAPDQPVLLTVGRLVARKGAAWFVRSVLPLLPPDAIYVVVGAGPERDAISAAAAEAGVADRIRMLGRASVDLLAAAYARADVFVMPNIPIAGDMEGFGLVALEAAASGLPVVASELEGITEALRHGCNATLVPASDADAFGRELRRLLALSSGARRLVGERNAAYTREHYGWHRTAIAYVDAMSSALGERRDDYVPGALVES